MLVGIGRRIEHAMKEAGKTPVDIARHLGISDSAVHQWFTKDSAPRNSRIPSIANHLGVSVSWIMSGEGSPLEGVSDLPNVNDHVDGMGLSPLVLWKSTQLVTNAQGAWLLRKEKIGEVERPYKMRFAKRGFAVEVLDVHNHPVYRLRDTLLINPDREVLPNDDCLLTGNLEAPEGAVTIVGCLIKATGSDWTISQYGKRGEHKFARSTYPNAWFVHGVIRN